MGEYRRPGNQYTKDRDRNKARSQANNRAKMQQEQRPQYRKQQRRRRPSKLERMVPVIVVLVLAAVFTVPILWAMGGSNKSNKEKKDYATRATTTTPIDREKEIAKYKGEAEKAAKFYDYDTAISAIDNALKYDKTNEDLKTLKIKYTADKGSLVEWNGEIENIFFHQLIVDTSITFSPVNEDNWSGFNSVMTTVAEFNAMMQSMYEKGYILIDFNDAYDIKTDSKTGEKSVIRKSLLLPEGKKPVILSQDDVNFYEKTTLKVGGLGQKFVLDDNGDVKVEYKDKDGNVTVGDYDMVPIVDTFVNEHPDFSYKGAKGYIGLTGYNGVLGYRTNDIHVDGNQTQSSNLEADKEMVKKIAKACKANGWKFASHSYSHGHMSEQDVKELKEDVKWWQKEVASLVGDVDTYIFPFGDWAQYDDNNVTKEKLKVLTDAGFKFLCGVGIKPYNVEKGSYVFVDRANLDGFSLHNRQEILLKFFDSDNIFDKGRPDAKYGLTIS